MTAEAFLVQLLRLAGNIDGTPDAIYSEADFGADALNLLEEHYGCKTCHALIAEGRGVSWGGYSYHRAQCIPSDLKLCTACDTLEDGRRVRDGLCEGCRAKSGVGTLDDIFGEG